MTDIYDEAIQATLEHDNIKQSWFEGGNTENMSLHGLLFRTCPHLDCCLTEYKNGMGDPDIAPDILDDLRNDDLMPSTIEELEQRWDGADTEARTTLLERFAMYNRELDEVFDTVREHVRIALERAGKAR